SLAFSDVSFRVGNAINLFGQPLAVSNCWIANTLPPAGSRRDRAFKSYFVYFKGVIAQIYTQPNISPQHLQPNQQVAWVYFHSDDVQLDISDLTMWRGFSQISDRIPC